MLLRNIYKEESLSKGHAPNLQLPKTLPWCLLPLAAVCLHVGIFHPPLNAMSCRRLKGKVKGLVDGSMVDINALSCWVEEGFEVIRREGSKRID